MLRSLRARLTLVMIVLVLLPLVGVGVVLTQLAQDVQHTQARDIESAHAAAVAADIEALMNNNTQELMMLAQVYRLAALSREEQQAALAELMAYDPNLHSLALIDHSGRETIHITREGVVSSDQLMNRMTSSEYLVPARTRLIYYGPVDLNTLSGTPLVTIAVPAYRPGSTSVDAIVTGIFRLDPLWEAVSTEEHGSSHQIFVVDGAGRVIAHQDPQVVLNGTRFTLAGAVGTPFLGETTGLSGKKVIMATVPFKFGDQVFTVVTEHATSDALRPAYQTRNIVTSATLLAGTLTALLAIYLLTRLTRPLAALATAARRLGAGDFTVRAEETGGAELAAVAHAFNEMAGQLASMVETLEQRITARTRDLQLAARLSNQIATILDPDELLPQVVELTKENFKLYHAHIYLVDERTQSLRLTAGAGEAGRVMRERGHRIPLRANSLVARAARENRPVVVHDVAQDANFMPNPLLPDTRSEAAVPLAVGNRVVGVLDVQSDQVARFDTDMQTVLQTMAGQIAVAITNAQMFAETERTSRREHTLSAITDAIQAATTIDDVLQITARELGKALKVSRTAVELKLPAAPTAAETQAAQE